MRPFSGSRYSHYGDSLPVGGKGEHGGNDHPGRCISEPSHQYFRTQPPFDYMLLCKSGGRPCAGLLPSARKKAAQSYGVILYTRYDAEPGASVPVIGSFDRYLPMTLAYEWMVSGNYYDKTRYAMVQTYLWGCLAGYEEAWDVQEEMMHKLEGVIRDGKVLPFFHEMREYVENGLEEYDNQGNTDLPEWNGRQQRIKLMTHPPPNQPG